MAGMSSRERTRASILSASVEAIAGATLADLVSFLTPASVGGLFAQKPPSIKTLRNLFRPDDPEPGFASTEMWRTFLLQVGDGFASPGGLPMELAPPSLVSPFGNVLLEHYEHVWLSPGLSHAYENLVLLALATCRTDPHARSLLNRAEAAQRSWLLPRLRATGANQAEAASALNALSTVRTGQILAARGCETAPAHDAIRTACAVLADQFAHALEPSGPVESWRFGYRQRPDPVSSPRQKAVTAALVAVANADYGELFAWLTPSRIAASASVDRKTVAYHFPDPTTPGIFSRAELLRAVEQTLFGSRDGLDLEPNVLERAVGCLHYTGAASRRESWLRRRGGSTKETVFADLAAMGRSTPEDTAEVAAAMIHIMCAGNDAALWRLGRPLNNVVRDGLIPPILELMSTPVEGSPGTGLATPQIP